MNNDILAEIQRGITTAFIDKNAESSESFQPQFISNDYREGKKVLSSIEGELLSCDQFFISVAFITLSGIEPLLQILKVLEKRGVKGQILTTDYLNFSEPNALKKLHTLSNIEVRMFRVQGGNGFHTKGYIFRKSELYKIIVGSSNLTAKALTENKEWNTKILSTANGEYADQLLAEFEALWNDENSLSFDAFFADYEQRYRNLNSVLQAVKDASRTQGGVGYSVHEIQPNSMQRAFLKNLNELQDRHQSRALLISATGTGKTYASAFAARQFNPRRMLFLVHREQVAKKAMESYRKVINNGRTYGLLSGTSKETNADYIFSTIQTISKDETLHQFAKNAFDLIIVDEVHHAAASTYQKLLNYFTPKFWLGMTGSPDRADGYDIYDLFDHNIACEIRLQQALEDDLLCPFHYFGITDQTIDDQEPLSPKTDRSLSALLSDERIDHIVQNAEYFGYSGNRVKGLIFCSRREEGEGLSEKLNERGYRTVFIAGDDHGKEGLTAEEYREQQIERLTADEGHDLLDYIITVDIFNEGVDIPEVNQVILLRPTQSPVVFIQQLGRGLRKHEGKEFVVILDFIGNYTNNYMIPIALSGDRSYNKDNIRKYVREGNRIIPGSSTIHFDEISKERIYQSINQSTTPSALKKEKYELLKAKLGRIPTILDFYQYGEIDPTLFIDGKIRSYDEYVRKVDRNYHVTFTADQQLVLEYITRFFLNGMRPHELLMMQMLVDGETITPKIFAERLKAFDPNSRFSMEDYRSSVRMLLNQFANRPEDKKLFAAMSILKGGDTGYYSSTGFSISLLDGNFRVELCTLIAYGLHLYKDKYAKHDSNHLVLYEKYSRRDVCRLLDWDKDESSTIYGYTFKHHQCPIFVTYEKLEGISKSIQYADEFVNPGVFSWMTRNHVTMKHPDIIRLQESEKNGMEIFLFVKKSDGEGNDHYYLGKVKPIHYEETVQMDDHGRECPIVNVQMKLEHAVREDIFDYLVK
ncbi:MAG: DEAD/DEAH box helicase [Stecheria intestinalis]|nr:DEAD/DEAH box helicase [Stecheria intestinalis]